MIKRFHVQNYKALRDISLELTPVHVLIGPNDSGKTSILEGLTALGRMMVGHGVASAFEGPWTGRQLVWRGQPDAAVTFDVDVDADGLHLNYAITFKFEEHERGARKVNETIARINPRTREVINSVVIP